MTNTSTLMKLTKAQLVEKVQQLEELVAHFTEESLANNVNASEDYGYPVEEPEEDEPDFEEEMLTAYDIAQCTEEEAPQAVKAPEFDYKQYIDFKLAPMLRNQPYSPMQTKLADTISCHYFAEFDISADTTRGQLSDKLHRALVMIRDKQLKRRPDAEIIALIEKTFGGER